ncbi:hypothetical protein B0H10DRAFT_1846229, partial [Mycena sp. CBHHK59/15]
ILQVDINIPAALIRQGIIPCAPKKPTVGITTRALEMFQVLHLRAPGLTKYGYLKGLCDLHKVPYSPGLSEQFTIAYDVYVSLLDATRKGVEKELNPCTYKLEGGACLIFQMLFTMDGNDSLKRILRRSKLAEEVEDEEGNISRAGPSKERTDTRVPPGDYYLGREKVDKWTREVIANLLGDEVNLDDDGDNPCAERWKNMVNGLTAHMWGIFDETGIFLALCRHGFVLLVADMVRSGELAKYPLAMVEALLNALGKGLGGGYDIGCKFKSTLGRSPLGALSRAKGYQSLVVAFHGHAHNRLCQLKFLATYMVGLGIEDLEGCERFFSKSNALASSTSYASVFHRKQDIVGFMSHMDRLETSANLSLCFLLPS